MILRDATKASVVFFVIFIVVATWWRWPEDTVSGLWMGNANGETIRLAFVQEPAGTIQGHGVIMDAGAVTSAAGTVEGTRVGDRIAIVLSANQQQVVTLLMQLGSRRQLIGEYFKPGAKALSITLTKQ